MFVRRIGTIEPNTTQVVRRKYPSEVKAGDKIYGSSGNVSVVMDVYNEDPDNYCFSTEHASYNWNKHAWVRVLETITHIPVLGMEDAVNG